MTCQRGRPFHGDTRLRKQCLNTLSSRRRPPLIHITWRHQYDALAYLKLKDGIIIMTFRFKIPALHYTAPTSLLVHYSTELHCTAPLQCIPTTPLRFTALYSIHSTTTSPLHCTHYTASPILHSLRVTALRPHYYTEFYCTASTTLHPHCFTALNSVKATYSTGLGVLRCAAD